MAKTTENWIFICTSIHFMNKFKNQISQSNQACTSLYFLLSEYVKNYPPIFFIFFYIYCKY